MLSISQLTKTYSNGVRALDGINLNIPKGMFGLLGPNGPGPPFDAPPPILNPQRATAREPVSNSLLLQQCVFGRWNQAAIFFFSGPKFDLTFGRPKNRFFWFITLFRPNL